MRGRLTAYMAWQTRDFAFERGLPMLIVGTLILFPVIMMTRTMRTATPAGADIGQLALQMLGQSISLLAFVLVLLSVNGIVSNDRKRGYYRLLFAKPVSLLRYYAQSFLISAAGLLLMGLIILLTFYALAYPVLPWGLLAFFAIYFVGLGGLCFLFSCLMRADWILLAGVWMMASVLRTLYPADESWYGRVFHVILPPAHVVSDVSNALMHAQPLPTTGAVWLAGYGAAAFLFGMIILHRRPLAA
jgi:hypothetical protein